MNRSGLIGATMLAVVVAMTAPVAASQPSGARDTDLEESLVALYVTDIVIEECNWRVSDSDDKALEKAMKRLERRLGMTENQANELYDRIEDSLERKGTAVLCAPGGEYETTMRETLARVVRQARR